MGFQIDGLHNHLKESGCDTGEMNVWLAEDATAIVTRIEYKADNNQVIGYVPTLVPGTGLPKVESFPATSVSVVKNYVDLYTKNKSKSVYAIVAIPLSNKASPYVLCVFGTDNKFSYLNVLERYEILTRKITLIIRFYSQMVIC